MEQPKRIWIDRSGFSDLEDKSSKIWESDDLWEKLEEMVQITLPLPVHFYVSPDFFWITRIQTPIEKDLGSFLNREIGISSERWVWQLNEDHPESALLLVTLDEISKEMETIYLASKATCRFFLVPAKEPPGEHQDQYQIGYSIIRPNWGKFGLESWTLARQQKEGNALPEEWLSSPWLSWETHTEVQVKRLVQWRLKLWKAVFVMGLLALCSFGFLRFKTQSEQKQLSDAQNFLNEHLQESQELQALMDRGNIAWEKLKEIQGFSNRTHPYSDRTIKLAEGLLPGLMWTELIWQDDKFTITLEGAQMQTILDYVDFVRSLPGIREVTFEELKVKHRNKVFASKVQGEFH